MNYSTYRMSMGTKIKYALIYTGLFFLLGYVFYGSPLAGIPGFAAMPFMFKKKQKQLAQKNRDRLLLEFKELILSFSNALRAGYSIENAFIEAYGELKFLYEEDSLIMTESKQIISKMKNQQNLEDLLTDLGRRSCLEDIRDFAAVFQVAKKSGGNLPKIISETSQRISDKLNVSDEIRLMFAEKQFEQKIMNCLPVLIILYISVSNPGYFDPLYKNITGVIIMSVCLIVYIAAYFLSQKIMDIRV